MPDVVTMDKIVSLARRRGFVFPSSEIYGGLGSAYDYRHYGVLLKENVKARWLEAMVRERTGLELLDAGDRRRPFVPAFDVAHHRPDASRWCGDVNGDPVHHGVVYWSVTSVRGPETSIVC